VARLECVGPDEADALSRPVHIARPGATSGINPHRPDRMSLARTALLTILIGLEGNVSKNEQSYAASATGAGAGAAVSMARM
jgi:hypothetical protein